MEIKGTVLLAIRDFVKLNRPDKYDSWLNSMNEATRQIYRSSIDSTKWYDVKVAVEPTKKISELFFGNDIKKGSWESGRFSAEKGLTGIYKLFVKASSPSFIISRANMVMARYYQPLDMTTEKNGANSVVVNMKYNDKPEAVVEYRIAGWIEKALEISGCENVIVDISKSLSRGDDQTAFSCSWD